VRALVTVDPKGHITNVDILESQPPRVFDRSVRETLSGWKCSADGTTYKAYVDINFTLNDE
jgi:TonB family protein